MSFWQSVRRMFKLSDTPLIAAECSATGAILEMSKEKAMQLSTVFACVRLISETVGTLPCILYRREDGQGKTPAPEHPLYFLLHDSPNADFTGVEYFERMAADLCLWGNHFSEVGRGVSGKIVALTGLDPALVSVGRTTAGGVLYMYADPYRGWREIPEANMFHVRGFAKTNDDLLGLSPISCARVSLDIASSSDAVAANTYKNGMRPSGVLSTDRVLTPEQREQERAWVQKAVGGLKGAGGVLVAEAGYKYQQLSMNPVDAQMLENRAFNVEDICRWFRVPPFMVGHTEKSTSWGSGLEQQGQAFATYTLRPYLARIESAVEKKLITPTERRNYVVEFNLEGLLRADSAGRAAHYSTALQNGWMNRDDVRAKENMRKIPGGDVYTVQANLLPLDKIGEMDRFRGRRQSDGIGTEKPAA
jgi:HK97 family phage portal protein